MKTFISNNWVSVITSMLAIIGGIGTIYQYFDKKTEERRWKEFEVYHSLIEKLSNMSNTTGMDSQIAIVNELRYFKRYDQLSLRILNGLKKSWAANTKVGRLLDEIDSVIGDIEKRKTRPRLR
ncbi:MAG: hypothetical protein LBO71_06460 [Prevotellaceae bacterium]|jgi:hypothetical protein|nr:hypothetical protein [Prevotellaceae bacterium]